MEYKLGGLGLVLLGVFFIIFGNTRFGPADEAREGFLMPIWLDQLIKWGIGGICVWFGLYLIFSNGHIV